MDIKEALKNFSKKRIAIVGDVMLDKFVYGNVERVSPEAPVPVIRVENEVYGLGGAANVAANIKSLGGEVSLFGYTGDDSAKEILIKELSKREIEYELFPNFTQTIEKTRIIGNRRHQIVRIDKESSNSIPKQNEQKLFNKIFELTPEVIIISDYAKGTISQNLVRKLIYSHSKVIADPKPKNQIDYSGINLITPNLKEGREITGLQKVSEIGRKLQEMYECDILLTKGKDGMTLFKGNKETNIPTQAKQVYDVSGAGDTVIAVLGLGLANGLNLKDSAFLANQAAGIAVGKPETATISFSELEQIIESEQGKIKSLDALKITRENYKIKGRRFVWTNGCFDILHRGHVDYLKKAKMLGDYLVIGLNSDESVRQLKGKGRPINSEKNRAMVLSSLEYVDAIVIFPETNVCNCLKKLKPDVYVKAGDYDLEGMNKDEKNVHQSYGGEFKFIPIIYDDSTTKIIDKIKNNKD